ncbi:MAG: ABC transporter ATP-binding protein [Elusimicrobia bacterium]|nr:ABC transporter ATP-binding protein [Elusimicrobiota bacterium]
MTQPVIKVQAAVKRFKTGSHEVRAVDGVDLEIAAGDFAALAGPSGSGKTTLLNLIGGLDRPDRGEVWIDGQPTSRLSDRELSEMRLRKIGFVFQSYNLIPVLSAFENVQFILQIQGVPEPRHGERIRPILRALGLHGLEHRRPTQLSGGQQQRVAVARSVVGSPSIVLADEPTANLDSETAGHLMELMRQLNEERGVTFLFSSHDPMVLERARRVVRLKDGKISAIETK